MTKTQQNPLISIIVPVHNIADYLPRCIDSITAQTYSNLEVICVENNSTDNSLEVLNQCAAKDKRVAVLSTAKQGVTNARLQGIKHAKGEYIGFVDGDDYIDKGMFERLLANAQKHNADISHCGHMVHRENKAPEALIADIASLTVDNKENVYSLCAGQHLVLQDADEGLKDLIEGSYEPGLWNKLYKHSLFHSLLQDNLIDLSLKENEDLLMNYYLFKQSKSSVYSSFTPYHYIKRDSSASSWAKNRSSNDYLFKDPITVKQIIKDDCTGTSIEQTARKMYLSTCINSYNSCLVSKGKAGEAGLKEIAALLKKNKQDIALLPKQRQRLAKMIMHTPKLYKNIYLAAKGK